MLTEARFKSILLDTPSREVDIFGIIRDRPFLSFLPAATTTAVSLMLAVPFVVALAFQEWKPAANYLLSIGISLILGSALRLLRVAPARLSRRQALAVTGFAWIVLAFMAAIPLYMSGHFNRFVDALFEGVSGLTTTVPAWLSISTICLWRTTSGAS